MSTRPGSTLDAIALTSLGPDEFDDPALPLPESPEPPELPELPNPPPNGEPLPKGLPEPDPPAPEPDPEPDGMRVEPDEGANACVLFPLVHAAWPMPTPAARMATAAVPASRPLRRWWPPPPDAPCTLGAGHTGAAGSVS